jgi:hypothetical protein
MPAESRHFWFCDIGDDDVLMRILVLSGYTEERPFFHPR